MRINNEAKRDTHQTFLEGKEALLVGVGEELFTEGFHNHILVKEIFFLFLRSEIRAIGINLGQRRGEFGEEFLLMWERTEKPDE